MDQSKTQDGLNNQELRKILMPMFERYIGIDYSGAQGPDDGIDGIQIYVTGGQQGGTPTLWQHGCRIMTKEARSLAISTLLTNEEKEQAMLEGWILGVM